MSGRHTAAGRSGEELAAWFLRTRGCAVVERNAFVGPDEIDLIVFEHDVMVAVEVKSTTRATDPIEAVDDHKWRRIVRSVAGSRHRIGRIDLLGVTMTADRVTFRWLRGVS